MTPPISDPGYAAAKQKRYRERLRQREEEEASRTALVPLVRCVLAYAHASFTPDRNVPAIARSLWPHDREALALVQRAASSPAMTTQAGWAQELAINTVSQLLIALGPQSAGSELLKLTNILTLDRYGSITVPALVASAGNAAFVGQGQPIPMVQLDASKNVLLEPRKLATGFSLTREMIQSSNAEALVQMVMVNSLVLSLDAALLSATAGDAVRPPGLLVGITPLIAATGAGVDAMRQDLGALAAAVAPVGGFDIIYVAAPGEAVKIALTAGPNFKFKVLSSGALPEKTVLAVAPVAVVAAADPTPRIEEGREALVHHHTAPTDINPGTLAVPVKSAFQTDTSMFRLILNVTWNLLHPSGAAWVQNVTW